MAKIIGTLVFVTVFAVARASSGEVVNRIVATIDGSPVTARQVEEFGRRGGAENVPPGGTSAVLDALITEKLIELEAANKGISISGDDVDRYIETIKERNKLDDERLAAAVKAQGLSMDDYRKQVKREIERQQLINKEIRGKVNVTPEEIDRYYKAHSEEYSVPPGYKVAHIVVAVRSGASGSETAAARAKADGIYDQLEKGADFAELAAKVSDDAGSAKDGGVLGWFKKGELIESLEKAALGLEVGEISKPVRGPQGFHILKLLETRAAAGTLSEGDAADIKEKLYGEALEARFNEWIKTDLRKHHQVEILP